MMENTNLVYTNQLPGRTLTANGNEYLFFSGTSYLGISKQKEFRYNLMEGMEFYGTNYSSSRNSNLVLNIYEEAEAYLAAYTGAEAAVTVSSGYLAGQTLIHTLRETGRFIFAPQTHPAMWLNGGGNTCHIPQMDYESWVKDMLNSIHTSSEKRLIIISNSLDPLKACNYHFEWITELPEDKEITLVIDDSHGFGITGNNGSGIYASLKHHQGIRLIVVSSFGKAFGIPGGVILGDKKTIDQVKTSPFFGGASPVIPAYLYAFLKSETLFQKARKQLFSNINHFLQHLSKQDQFQFFHHYPVFYTPVEALCNYLLIINKIMISSFRYPTPDDESITRIVINSLHTSGDIELLAERINSFGFS